MKFERVAIIGPSRHGAAAVQPLVNALDQAGIAVDTRFTASAREGTHEAVQAVLAGADLLVAAGGDGTLLSVLEPALEAGVPVAPLPCGNSNDYARGLGFDDWKTLLGAILFGRVENADAAWGTFSTPAGDVHAPFCSTAGVGLLAGVFAREREGVGARIRDRLGNAAYPVLTFLEALGCRATRAHLEIDGRILDTPLKLLELSKVPSAGGVPFTPHARMDGGGFHGWLLGDAPLPLTAAAFFAAMGGLRPARLPRVEEFSDEPTANRWGITAPRVVVIETPDPFAIHLHGDFVGETPARFEICADALPVLRLPSG